MGLSIVERHELILKKLENEGKVSALELSELFNVSTVTIRKDLKLLEDRQLLYRSHGTAIPFNPYITTRPITEKENIFVEEKRAIASLAATFIQSNDYVIIASGTTLIELARQIQNVERLTVITASLNTALLLATIPNVEVIQLGGVIRKSSFSVIGPLAETMLSQFSCSKLFLGVDGIDLDYGLTTTNSMEASLNKEMINAAQKIIVLADSSKFGKKGFGRICGLEDVDIIITDSGIDEKYKNKLIDLGVDVKVV